MSWATAYIESLSQGATVSFRPRGNSMHPVIKSGQKVTVKPVENDDLKKGDILLCSVRNRHYLHYVKALRNNGQELLIGNNRGKLNGWIQKDNVYGVLIAKE